MLCNRESGCIFRAFSVSGKTFHGHKVLLSCYEYFSKLIEFPHQVQDVLQGVGRVCGVLGKHMQQTKQNQKQKNETQNSKSASPGPTIWDPPEMGALPQVRAPPELLMWSERRGRGLSSREGGTGLGFYLTPFLSTSESNNSINCQLSTW